ncbi:hypothetical protein [Pseudoneobacillus rhizosphaerae]|uniref:IS200/IS605 family transposase ISCbt2 n=1 Tax=Pseudoneobacillus rhizosphaerae TaxID=2880968 RepID=A0A9C7LA29_9BACI|nr:hypothetical protein [Pseudoneobacillus rhizosphaerae]CAG9607617.1 IS200/IS605 family transposase ISCbt2 [Pseudoneobacillus rhizosphaerae]
MARETTPSFIIEMEMLVSSSTRSTIVKELECNRVIYNTALGQYLKREEQMKRTKKYKRIYSQLKAINRKIESKKRDETALIKLGKEREGLIKNLQSLQGEFGLTEYSMHNYIKGVRSHFQNTVHSLVAQKTATRAWNTFKKKLFGQASKVKFVKKGEMNTFEGKNNTTGWIYKNRHIQYNLKMIPLIIKEKDTYVKEALHYIDSIDRSIKRLKRKLDRSRRTMNPENFDEKGRIKKGKKVWKYSHRYRKCKNQLKELYRKQSLYRKFSHQYEANRILTLGNTFFIEEMNFKALQKRSKKTEISEKTGKYKKKKRFGKSIAQKAPAMFVRLLEQKVLQAGGTFKKVQTTKFKASQYDHISNQYNKKELKERWHSFDDGTNVQRDLYSAFLLMCSNNSGTKSKRSLCIDQFDLFKKQHDKKIENLENQPTLTLNSGIKVKNKKATKTVA